jgi:hypothetical protein
MLVRAGVFSEYDSVNGVSANTMLGQIAPCGTGDSHIFVDEERLLASGVYSHVEKQVVEDIDGDEDDKVSSDNDVVDIQLPLLTVTGSAAIATNTDNTKLVVKGDELDVYD